MTKINSPAALIEAADNELEELRRDAARYRVLREHWLRIEEGSTVHRAPCRWVGFVVRRAPYSRARSSSKELREIAPGTPSLAVKRGADAVGKAQFCVLGK